MAINFLAPNYQAEGAYDDPPHPAKHRHSGRASAWRHPNRERLDDVEIHLRNSDNRSACGRGEQVLSPREFELCPVEERCVNCDRVADERSQDKPQVVSGPRALAVFLRYEAPNGYNFI
jgi:hypothetical protein